jgi:hypothetical protein
MAKLGTLQWLHETQGKTNWTERLSLTAQAVRSQISTQRRVKVKQKLRTCEVRDILPPDSAVAREALNIAREACSEALFNHSMRAYFWAKLLDSDECAYDDEGVFVACMLHDLGLTDQYRLQGGEQQCFTSVGAQMTQELAQRHAWSDTRMNLAANAIILHLNVIIGDEHGKEAKLVRAGSGGDVAGLGLDVLHRDQIDEVLGHFPRLNLKSEVMTALQKETAERPCCRTAFLCRRLGFTELIQRNRSFRE